MRLGLALVFGVLAGPALADPVLSLAVGQEAFAVNAGQVLSVQVRADYGGPTVVVTLEPGLRAGLQGFTKGHVGDEIVIRVCGVVVNRPRLSGAINDGVFAIQGNDRAAAEHLAAQLQAKDCRDVPLS